MAGPSVSIKDHWKEQRLFLSRIVAAAVVIVLLTGVLVGRLVQLQVLESERFTELSQGNRSRIEPLAPTRGIIYDRNGLVIAENLPTWQLVAVPEQIEDLETMLDELADLELVNEGEREELAELVRSHRGFERVALNNDLSESEAARFAVRRHRFPGIDIQEGLVRYYPFGDIAAHAVGYVGKISSNDLERIDRSDYAATSQIGKSGVERSYEDVLHGTVGYRQQLVNAQGRILLDPAAEGGRSSSVRGVGELETRWPEPGRNVVLSLDMRLQLAAHEALEGVRGAAVAIDTRNGDLLALVSTPSFDPNRFAKGLSRNDFVALNADLDKPMFNRALGGRYPPGSTIKPFLGLAALDFEAQRPGQTHFCRGYFTLPGHTHRYRDWRPEGHGEMSLHSAIVESCDVYFYNLAVNLGIDRMAEFLKRVGFGERTGIDIGGESAGLVPSPEWKREQFARREDQVWFPGETVITGIGQGFTQVTPVQLAHAGATLAARGEQHVPRLVIGTEDAGSRDMSWHEPVALPGLEDIAEPHWQTVHDAMIGVIEEPRGTARAVMSDTPYEVAGKTGTSQVFSIPQEEKYDAETVDDRLRDHGLFLAFAPAESPRVALAVIVENGGGASAASPIAREIFDAYFEQEEHVASER